MINLFTSWLKFLHKGDGFIKKVLILIMALILLVGSISYANDDKLSYINSLLKEEIAKLKEELLSLKLQLNNEKANNIPVLLYHHILMQKEMDDHNWNNNGSVISFESFTNQMKYLNENNYYTATLDELELFMDRKLDLPKKTVVITFDDGYLSNAIYAYPIMKEYNFKGTVFMMGLPSSKDKEDFNPQGLQYISVSEMYKYEDVFDFGSHTFNLHHKDNKGLPLLESLPKEAIIEDLTKNSELFHTKRIAYPYGGYNLKTLNCLKEIGYTMGFTVKHGYVSKRTNIYKIPRIIINSDVNISKFASLIDLR